MWKEEKTDKWLQLKLHTKAVHLANRFGTKDPIWNGQQIHWSSIFSEMIDEYWQNTYSSLILYLVKWNIVLLKKRDHILCTLISQPWSFYWGAQQSNRQMGSCCASSNWLPWWTNEINFTVQDTAKWFIVDNNNSAAASRRCIFPKYLRTCWDSVRDTYTKLGGSQIHDWFRNSMSKDVLLDLVMHSDVILNFKNRYMQYP